MPWELRGQKRYYYRSERVAGRPVRRYFGSGPAAELQAAADDLRRLRRPRPASGAGRRPGCGRPRPRWRCCVS